MIKQWMLLSMWLLTATGQAQEQDRPAQRQERAAPAVGDDSQEAPRLAVFDVNDLIDRAQRVNDWPAMTEAEQAEALRHEGEELARSLSLFVQPALREGTEEIRYLENGSLVALVRWDQQQWIQDQLDRRRLHPDTMILIEWRIALASKELVQELKLGPKSLILEHPDEVIEGLMEGGADMVIAPQVMTFDGQRFEISVLNETAYVKEYQVHEAVAPNGQRLVDPIVELVQDGLIIGGRALVLGDDAIGVDLSSKQAKLDKPIPEEETEHGPVGRPKVQTIERHTRMTLAPKKTSVYVSEQDDGKVLVELVRFSIVR
ncbi:MAG: hypothetical protein RL885_23430 [Planctomycetota bacterium]